MLKVEAELRSGAVVYRYRWDDGLPGVEGGFHICTAWLIEAYLRTGRRGDAEELFEQMLDTAGPTGLLPEQYDPFAERGLGQPPAGLQPPRSDPLRKRACQGLTTTIRWASSRTLQAIPDGPCWDRTSDLGWA